VTQPAVLFGGPSPEHDVSVLTGLQAVRALADEGRSVISIYWDKAGGFHEVDASEAKAFVDGAPRGARPLRLLAAADGGFVAEGRGGLLGGKGRELEIAAVLNCCHGGPGEDGSIQGAFDLAGVAYTGPTAAGAALGMDKLAFGAAVTAAGLPSLPRALVVAGDPPFEGPYIVKPRFGGSSIGIHVIGDWKSVQDKTAKGVHYRRGAVVEPYRGDAVDLNVAIRTFPELELSAVEKPLRSKGSSEILGYDDKYLGGEGMASAPRELPAVIDAAIEKRLRDIAAQVAVVTGVRGLSRLDFLLDGDELYVNEINTIPGSLARYLWIDPPVPFVRLLNEMLTEAETRPTHHYDATGADGTALRSAGSIASKLA
jgi:D-alanine-D-alanine ligase